MPQEICLFGPVPLGGVFLCPNEPRPSNREKRAGALDHPQRAGVITQPRWSSEQRREPHLRTGPSRNFMSLKKPRRMGGYAPGLMIHRSRRVEAGEETSLCAGTTKTKSPFGWIISLRICNVDARRIEEMFPLAIVADSPDHRHPRI